MQPINLKPVALVLALMFPAACTDADNQLADPDVVDNPLSSEPPNKGSGSEQGQGSETPDDPEFDYYPLEVGRRWDFIMSDRSTYRIDVVNYGLHQQRHSYEVRSGTVGWWGGTTVTYQYEQEGDLYQFGPGLNGKWARTMEGPPEDGKRFSYDFLWATRSLAWEHEGTISVPAGTFHDCFRLANVNSPFVEYTVYAPGVGPVYFVSGTDTGSLVNITTAI